MASQVITPDSFFNNCRHVWRSALYPFQTPVKIDAYILTNRGGAGLIGTDQHMKYTDRLSTAYGVTIARQNTDFHVTLITKPVQLSIVFRIIEFVLKKIFFFLQPSNQVEAPSILPSTILQNCKENDVLRFRWDGCLFEYRLKQQLQNDPRGKENFENFFLQLQQYMQDDKLKSTTPYLFEKDIPSSQEPKTFRLYTPNAQKNTLALDEAAFRKALENAQHCPVDLFQLDNGEFVLKMDGPGVKPEDVQIYVDRNNMVVLAHRELMSSLPAGTPIVLKNDRSEYLYRSVFLEHIDPSTLNVSCQYGVIQVTFKRLGSN